MDSFPAHTTASRPQMASHLSYAESMTELEKQALKDGSMLVKEAESEQKYAGEWLAGSSHYQMLVDALSDSDPRLRSRDPKAIAQKIAWRDYGRVAALEMDAGGEFEAPILFEKADSLHDYFAESQKAALTANQKPLHPSLHPDASTEEAASSSRGPQATPPRRRLFIMEGMGPGFVSVLGEHLGLHPSAFLDQERVIVMNTAAQGESDGMLLPSLSCSLASPDTCASQCHTTLKYFETLQLSRCPDNFRLVCGDTGRHIGVSRTDGQFTDVGVVRRKCTTWIRRTANRGWDCLVMCDPPVRRVHTGFEYRDVFEVQTRPYQGGYVDFVPQWAQIHRRESGHGSPPAPRDPRPSGPPRTSMLDDLVYYVREHAASLIVQGAYASSPLEALADPDMIVGTFVRKIVASHYLKLAGNVRAMLSSAQRALSRKHDLALLPMEKVEELWSDTQASERRVGEYGEDLEANMLKLCIPLEKPSPGRRSASATETASLAPRPLDTLYSHHSSSALSLASPERSVPRHRHQDHISSSRPARSTEGLCTARDGMDPAEPLLFRGRTDTVTTLISISGCEGDEQALGQEEEDEHSESEKEDAAAHSQRELELRQWLDTAVDYQFLLLRFREMRHRTECLNAAVTGLASITGNRQAYHEQQLALETARRSIREAKSSKAITLLGLIFIPLAYMSSVFSMTEPFGPGGEEFWLYFATSAPLIVLVLVAYTVLDAGYTDDGTSWSLAVFERTARRWFSRQPAG